MDESISKITLYSDKSNTSELQFPLLFEFETKYF